MSSSEGGIEIHQAVRGDEDVAVVRVAMPDHADTCLVGRNDFLLSDQITEGRFIAPPVDRPTFIERAGDQIGRVIEMAIERLVTRTSQTMVEQLVHRDTRGLIGSLVGQRSTVNVK